MTSSGWIRDNPLLAAANPWTLSAAAGNLDAYISAINRLPLLTLDENESAARELRANNSLTLLDGW